MENALAPTSDDLERAYRVHDPNMAGHQSAEAVIAGADGITVLCSANPKGDGEHTWLIRLTDDGATTWQRHFPASQGVGRAIAALPGGGFAIAGEIQRGPVEFQAYLLRTDATGNATTGGAAFGPRGVTSFSALAILGDGSALAGGSAGGHGWLVRTDAALHATWDAPLGDVDDVSGIATLDRGGFAVLARRERSTLGFGLTRATAFDADRRVRWQAQLPTSGRGEPAALAHLPDGSLAAVGHRTADEHAKAQIWVAHLTGAEPAWQRLLGPTDEERRGRAIAAFPDGSLAIAGDALRDGHRGLRVARLAADGTVAWERSFGGSGDDVARGIAATADGGLVVVGSTTSRGAGKTNVWILRLAADGSQLWERVFGTAGS